MAAIDDQRRAAGLTPLPNAKTSDAKKEHGHGRGTTTYHVVGGSPELRGVPLIGTGAGGLANTRPGGELGSLRKLEAELRDLRGSLTFNGMARFEVRVHVSTSGVLRYRRVIL